MWLGVVVIPFSHFLNTSQYGAHYNVASEIFKRNPVFGVGIKNYRSESVKKIYTDQNKNFMTLS